MKSTPLKILFFFYIVSLVTFPLIASHAQETGVNDPGKTAALRVYLDCDFFDRSFFIRSIPFVNFTRNQKLSQVYILVTTQHTGSGGHLFTIDYIGQETFEGKDQRLNFTSNQSDTEDIMREGLVHVIRMGLMPYVSQTDLSTSINITYDKAAEKAEKRITDPWNYWIFHINLNGDLGAEKSNKELTLSNSISAERITENWKFSSSFYYRHNQESYKSDNEEINSTLRNSELEFKLVKSLSSHLSLGFFARGEHSTYQNLDLQASVAPAVEYNFYPWNLSNRKILAIGYYLGYEYNRYLEETLYEKMMDQFIFGMLGVQARLIQPWGELDASLNFSHYYHNIKYHRIEADFDISYRVSKLLSFYVELRAESIHDQLYLPRGEASRDDILLQRRRLETNYSLGSEIGIRFTFGSIFNTIVNDRF